MLQANKPNTISRRSALAGLAGTAAATGITPAVAATISRATGDDAELLALKAKFDPLFATWVKMSTAAREEHKAFVSLYERETGLSYDERPAIDWEDPAWVAYQKTAEECHE